VAFLDYGNESASDPPIPHRNSLPEPVLPQRSAGNEFLQIIE
jgi:hypothetical protein